MGLAEAAGYLLSAEVESALTLVPFTKILSHFASISVSTEPPLILLHVLPILFADFSYSNDTAVPQAACDVMPHSVDLYFYIIMMKVAELMTMFALVPMTPRMSRVPCNDVENKSCV